MSEERKALREKLLSPRKNGYDRIKAEELQTMERYCGLYKTFLQQGKTERECTRVTVELARQAGAQVVGAACAIEKGFQGGGDRLRTQGVRVESLAIIEEMSDDGIRFRR